MTDAPKKSDPDNVFVTAGVKDPAKAYVFVPFNYRDAQAAIKEAGGKWAGSQWELTADALKSAEADIRAAARKDIELGAEGRKTREDGLKAEKGEAKPEKQRPIALLQPVTVRSRPTRPAFRSCPAASPKAAPSRWAATTLQ
jgi:hypothetical protein